jgi:hypothetical protein
LHERAFRKNGRVIQITSAICHHAAMKKVLAYFPIVLSLVVLGAHFIRDGNWLAVFGLAILIGMLFIRRPWVARLMQAVLVLGAFEWAHTTYLLVQMRAAQDQPFTRMLIILSIVALITACSALLFESSTLRKIYRQKDND